MTGTLLSRRQFLRGQPRLPIFSHVHGQRSASTPHTSTSTGLIAHIALQACLSSASQLCTVCTEHCREPAAITLRGMLPFVDAERCTGCGACAAACPSPLIAIQLRPRTTAHGA